MRNCTKLFSPFPISGLFFSIFFLIQCAGNAALGQYSDPSTVFVSLSPQYYFQDGARTNVDVPLGGRNSLQFSRSDLFSYQPLYMDLEFFDLENISQGFQELEAAGRYEFRVAGKYAIGRKSGLYRGFYWGPELRHGVFHSKMWSGAGSRETKALLTSRRMYTQAGLVTGWQKQYGYSSLIDVQLSLGFHSWTESTVEVWTPFGYLNPEIPVFGQILVALGTGMSVPHGVDSVKFRKTSRQILTTDFSAFLKRGLEFDWHLPIRGYRTVGFKGGYYNNFSAEVFYTRTGRIHSYQGGRGGVQVRQYLPSAEVFNGPFLEMNATYRRVRFQFLGADQLYEQNFSSLSLGWSIGITKTFSDFFIAEATLGNRMILAETRYRERFPGVDFIRGIGSEINLRIGIVL